MEPTSAQWKATLDSVMPADFKDWWENSINDLPEVAAMVIRNLRERAEAAEEQLEAMVDDRELLTIAYMSGYKDGEKAMRDRRCGTCEYCSAVGNGYKRCDCPYVPAALYQGWVAENFACTHRKKKKG